MKHRLYVAPPVPADRPLELDRERAHYLTRVLRLRRGEEIECFDGTGHAWIARLVEATAGAATLALERLVADEPEPEPRLHLVQGLLKGASMDLVVQKATELGITDLWPVMAERSNVPTAATRLDRKHRHWQRVTESATEQCGGLHLPRLHPIDVLGTFLRAAPAAAPGARLILLDPGSPPLPLDLPRAAVCLLVGPEGGWSDGERRQALEAGAQRYGLGPRILRGETAPLAALAALRHGWGWH